MTRGNLSQWGAWSGRLARGGRRENNARTEVTLPADTTLYFTNFRPEAGRKERGSGHVLAYSDGFPHRGGYFVHSNSQLYMCKTIIKAPLFPERILRRVITKLALFYNFYNRPLLYTAGVFLRHGRMHSYTYSSLPCNLLQSSWVRLSATHTHTHTHTHKHTHTHVHAHTKHPHPHHTPPPHTHTCECVGWAVVRCHYIPLCLSVSWAKQFLLATEL